MASDLITDLGESLAADLQDQDWGMELSASFAYMVNTEPKECQNLRLIVVPKLWTGQAANRGGDGIEDISYYISALVAVPAASSIHVSPLLQLVCDIVQHYESVTGRIVGSGIVVTVERPNPVVDGEWLAKGLFLSAPTVGLRAAI